ncbi:uncharacterized protein LOC143260796 [Megalopta genalis]|uniref:uncharacterized protein LOC143260796 n=1 Tax=Megalopta genalis TaxID=115081 RepID=UPI003FD4CCAA
MEAFKLMFNVFALMVVAFISFGYAEPEADPSPEANADADPMSINNRSKRYNATVRIVPAPAETTSFMEAFKLIFNVVALMVVAFISFGYAEPEANPSAEADADADPVNWLKLGKKIVGALG